MKFLVYGAGSIGCVFGGFLAKAGEEVVLLGRPGHIEIMKAKGLDITGIWGDHHVPGILGYTNSADLKEDHANTFDLVLLTVKSYDTVAAMADIRNIASENTYVLSLQNGIGNVESIAKIIGPEMTLGGRVIFGAEFVAPGSVKVTVSAEDVAIGRISLKTPKEPVEEMANLFTLSGIKTIATDEIQKYIWGKVLYNCALNALATLLGINYGALIETEYTRDIMRRIVAEIYAVAQKKGIELELKTKEEYIKILFNRLIPMTSSHKPSMLRDIEKIKKTEIDYLNGMIVQMGKDIGIHAPTNQFLTELIKFKELKHQ
ncbi:MAG: ketopantoate reductase family protein [Candidatus Saganbacteria bacterium]|nr:ketopantoate reductase family protein [Candidatus Saganbacteria bacterium]